MRRLLVVAIGCVAALNSAFGQNFQDGSRWFNASSWKATLTGSGKGEGSLPGGSCTNSYDNVQSADLTAVLTGTPPMYPYGDWTGPTSSGLSLTLTTYNMCPSTSCTSTVSAHDASAPLELTIDPTGNSTYSVIFAPLTASETTCSGPPTAESYIWGPEYNPDGSVTGTGVGGQIPLPAKGVDLVYTVPTYTEPSPSLFPATWNISWKFTPTCKIELPVLLWQGDPTWAGDHYDHSTQTPNTIGRWGCAMTSMIMAMDYEGFGDQSFVGSDPGSVNHFMTNEVGDFNGAVVNWESAVHDLSRGALRWNDLGGSLSSIGGNSAARDLLDSQLCGADPHPVIVGVKHCTDANGNPRFPCHFVLVTGRDGTDYTIADPATGTLGSLMESYGSDFTTRGIVVGSGGGAQPDSETSSQTSSGSSSSLDLAVDQNASMMATDSMFHETGVDPAGGAILQQIPGSAYFIDQIEDATELGSTGAADVTPPGHTLEMSQPPAEALRVVVNGNAQGPFTLTIRAFSHDGGAQPPVVVQGKAQPGSTFTYILAFNPAIGSTPALTAMPGDRNGDGKVDCTDLAIVKAAFGKSIGQTGYDPRADVNGDGVINIIDLATVAHALPANVACQ